MLNSWNISQFHEDSLKIPDTNFTRLYVYLFLVFSTDYCILFHIALHSYLGTYL